MLGLTLVLLWSEWHVFTRRLLSFKFFIRFYSNDAAVVMTLKQKTVNISWEFGLNTEVFCASNRPGKTSVPLEVSLCAEPSNINPSNQFILFIALSRWLLSLTFGYSKFGFILVDAGKKKNIF